MSLADTLRRLPPAATDFARSLFDHHWFEASWLYERREVLHGQGALLCADGWLELEERTDAHVRALAKGGPLVLGECESKAIDGDVGELHTAVRLLCRGNQIDRFNALVERIDWQEPRRAWAVVDALAWDAPDAWQALLGALLGDEDVPDEVLGPLARVVGLRAWPLGDALLGVLEDRAGDLEAVTWALGVLRMSEALPELYAVIQEEQAPAVKQAAAIAALRFAPGEVLAFLQQVVAKEAWAAIPLAIGGGPQVWSALSGAAKASPTPEHMWAIGLFGYVGGIDLLLELVEDEACGAAAAEGLYLLTGADLFEEGYEVDPGAEAEAEAEPPVEGEEGEEPPGLLVSRLPRSKATWSTWITEHGAGSQTTATARIRLGTPFDLVSAREEPATTKLAARLRQWMIEELDIRYRLHATHWPRLSQTMMRCALRSSQAATQAKTIPGDWYSAGQPSRVAMAPLGHYNAGSTSAKGTS